MFERDFASFSLTVLPKNNDSKNFLANALHKIYLLFLKHKQNFVLDGKENAGKDPESKASWILWDWSTNRSLATVAGVVNILPAYPAFYSPFSECLMSFSKFDYKLQFLVDFLIQSLSGRLISMNIQSITFLDAFPGFAFFFFKEKVNFGKRINVIQL